VVIDDFDFACISILPPKTDPPLLVYPNAVLALPRTMQTLQPITRWYIQLGNADCPIQLVQLSPRNRP
jgi:hypothetical protein